MVIEKPLLKVLLLTIQDLILLHLLGCNIVSLFSGIVTFTGFSGAGGYTITIQSLEFTASYCHVSPNFKVFVGQSVKKGSIIGKVGPKNVYGVPNNPYKDKNSALWSPAGPPARRVAPGPLPSCWIRAIFWRATSSTIWSMRCSSTPLTR